MKRSSGEVTDDEGRRRFHGAFTGGFSAGYYNSVGSKEGWQPATFSSSRNERGRAVQQRAEDFMDADDDPLLGKRLETSAQYDTLQAARTTLVQQQQKLANSAAAPRNAFEARVLSAMQPSTLSSPPLNFLDALVRPVNDSIGAKLLNRMGGWKEGHGIGPRLRRKKIVDASGAADDQVDDADNVVYVPPRVSIDVASFPKPKLDRYGAGFDPYTNAPEFARYKQQQASVLAHKQQATRQVVTFADAMRVSTGSDATATAFGLSALEDHDDLDVYGTAAMADFDTVIGAPERLTNGPARKLLESDESLSRRRQSLRVGSDGRPALPGFVYAEKRDKPPKAVAVRLDVPRTFRPHHTFHDDSNSAGQVDAAAALYKQHNFSTTEQHGRSATMTATQRAALLGEAAALSAAPTVTPSLRVAASVDVSAASQSELPLPTVCERQPLVQDGAAAQLMANISASIAKRFVSASAATTDEPQQQLSSAEAPATEPAAAVKSHRSESVWVPSPLLCKRFHVKCVARGAPLDAVDETTKRDLFDKELVPHLVEFAAERRADAAVSRSIGAGGADSAPARRVASRFGPRLREMQEPVADSNGAGAPPLLPVVAKPAPSLLKAIFEPSDASDINEDDVDDDSDNDSDASRASAKERTTSSSSSSNAATLHNGTVAQSHCNNSVEQQQNETQRNAFAARESRTVSSGSSSSSDADSNNNNSVSALHRAAVAAVTTRSNDVDSADAASRRETKDRKASKKKSKKHKKSERRKSHKKTHKREKHKRKRRHSSDSDDSDSDSESDRAHRKSRKKTARRRSRSRSASREASRSNRSRTKHDRH